MHLLRSTPFNVVHRVTFQHYDNLPSRVISEKQSGDLEHALGKKLWLWFSLSFSDIFSNPPSYCASAQPWHLHQEPTLVSSPPRWEELKVKRKRNLIRFLDPQTTGLQIMVINLVFYSHATSVLDLFFAMDKDSPSCTQHLLRKGLSVSHLAHVKAEPSLVQGPGFGSGRFLPVLPFGLLPVALVILSTPLLPEESWGFIWYWANSDQRMCIFLNGIQ